MNTILIFIRDIINRYFALTIIRHFKKDLKRYIGVEIVGWELIGHTISYTLNREIEGYQEDSYIMTVAEINAKYSFTKLYLE